MKKYFYLLFLSLAGFACHKDEKPTPSAITDARIIRLKEMVSQGLPSPYFNFTYDNNNFVTHLQHASGLLQYELQYHNGRLVSMFNNTFANKDTLLYHYASNRVVRIDIVESESGKTKEAELLYDDNGQLKEIRWKKLNANFSTFVTRKLVFTYDKGHNLAQYEDHRNLGDGLELFQTHYFDKYDDKPNVEANYLIKDIFEHFLFLPQVQLQRNNPLSERIAGRQNDWSIQYSYTFNNGLPDSKTADLKQTRGLGAGSAIRSISTYAYY